MKMLYKNPWVMCTSGNRAKIVEQILEEAYREWLNIEGSFVLRAFCVR
jgi:hypothetical protein